MPTRGVPRARAAKQLQRRIDVGRALHVDPDEVAACVGVLDQALELRSHSSASRSRPSCVGLTEICASSPAACDLVEHVEVVLRDLLGLVDASSGSRRAASGSCVMPCCCCAARPRSASSIRSPGMNARPIADERRLRRVLAQPRVGRHREQHLAHHAHRDPCALEWATCTVHLH